MVSHTLSIMPSGHQVQHCQPLAKKSQYTFCKVRKSFHTLHSQTGTIYPWKIKKKKKTNKLALCATYTVNFTRIEKRNLYTACSFCNQTTKYCWQQARYLQSRTSHAWNWNTFSLHSVKKNFHTTVGEVATFTSVLTIQIFLSCILAQLPPLTGSLLCITKV